MSEHASLVRFARMISSEGLDPVKLLRVGPDEAMDRLGMRDPARSKSITLEDSCSVLDSSASCGARQGRQDLCMQRVVQPPSAAWHPLCISGWAESTHSDGTR